MFEDQSEAQRLLFCRAVVCLIAADDHLAVKERQELGDLIFALGFDPEWPLVARMVGGELLSPSPIGEIVAQIESPEMRAGLLRVMVEVAWSDGDLAAPERATIREAARVAGYDPRIADDLGALMRPPTLLPEDGILFCQAAAAVMLADKDAAAEEQIVIRALAERFGVEPDDDDLVAALEVPPDISDVAEMIDQRAIGIYLLRVLAEVAWADGKLRYAEASALDAAGVALGLDLPMTQEIIRWVHDLARNERL